MDIQKELLEFLCYDLIKNNNGLEVESKLLSFSIKSQLIKQGVVTTRHLIDNINKANYLVEILNTGRRSDLLKQYKKEIYNKILSTKEGI